jgi:hypothetical protein
LLFVLSLARPSHPTTTPRALPSKVWSSISPFLQGSIPLVKSIKTCSFLEILIACLFSPRVILFCQKRSYCCVGTSTHSHNTPLILRQVLLCRQLQCSFLPCDNATILAEVAPSPYMPANSHLPQHTRTPHLCTNPLPIVRQFTTMHPSSEAASGSQDQGIACKQHEPVLDSQESC